MSDYDEPNRAGPSITSASNERIRYIKSLYRTSTRRKEGLFVVEGVRLLEDALDAGARPELVLVDEEQLERTPRGAALLKRLREFELWTVTPEVLSALSDTVTPQGAIALFRIPETPKQPDLGAVTLILDRISDPGNAGTILRSAEASGVVKTVAFIDSVDAYSPKVVRAGMGAHFRLTILEDAHFADVQALLKERPIYAAESDGATLYDQVDWAKDSALVIGGEAEGPGDAALSAATEKIRIPMAGGTESLNAAMAGTVLLFESARARRAAGLLETAPPRARPHRESSERAPRPPRPRLDEDEEPRRPAHGERPFGQRPFGQRPFGDRPYRERPTGERPFRDRPPEERPYRERSFDERPFRERSFEERPYRDRPAADRPFRDQPYGERPYREQSFRDQPSGEERGDERSFRERPYRDNSFGGRPGDERPAGNRPRGEKPFDNRPYGPRQSGERPFNEKPFVNQPFGPRSNPPGKSGYPKGGGKPFGERGFRGRDEGRPSNDHGPRDRDEGRPFNDRGFRGSQEGRPFNDRGPRDRDEGRPFNDRGPRDRNEGRPGEGGFRGGPPRRDQSGGGPPGRPRDSGSPGAPSDRPFGKPPGPSSDWDGGRVEYPRRRPRL